jgi:hypothetical protein
MSLKGQFKTEAALVRDGTWFDVTTNSDGSKCRVKLRRSGRGNPLWGIAFREQTKDVDTDALTPQEDAVIMGRTMAEAAVVDWEHMQPEDDGVGARLQRRECCEASHRSRLARLAHGLAGQGRGHQGLSSQAGS